MGKKTTSTANIGNIAPQKTTSPARLDSIACQTASIIMTAAMALSLAGCKRYFDEGPVLGYAVNDYEARHPIEVVKNSKEISLSASKGMYGLTKHQKRKVKKFLAAYKANPQNRLTIAAPSGAENESVTFHMLSHIRQLIEEYGIPKTAIQFRPYYAEGRSQPPIRMAFQHDTAIPPECGDWSENLARNSSNLPYPNFGCAMQNNMAAMIANPRDLIEPRGGSAPRDGARRDTVYDKYVKGESTISQKSEEESGKVSDVAK